MHSVPSHSAHKPHDSDYSRNRARSIRFLILLAAILALAFFLSLRAGSYNTPAAELIRGIFGRASDAKINLVIRNNRLPRICTAMVAGAGLGLAIARDIAQAHKGTIAVTGTVRLRESPNAKLATGEIEVVPEKIEILGRCRYNELPFEINRSR